MAESHVSYCQRKILKNPARYRRYIEQRTVSPPTSPGCLLWVGQLNTHGYGVIGVRSNKSNSYPILVHRIVACLERGFNLTSDKLVCHTCDNRTCVNPEHIFIGTVKDNNRDCVKKGRKARQCGTLNSSAKLTETDVREMRSRHEWGARQVDLAKAFNVTTGTVAKIVHGKLWSHI